MCGSAACSAWGHELLTTISVFSLDASRQVGDGIAASSIRWPNSNVRPIPLRGDGL